MRSFLDIPSRIFRRNAGAVAERAVLTDQSAVLRHVSLFYVTAVCLALPVAVVFGVFEVYLPFIVCGLFGGGAVAALVLGAQGRSDAALGVHMAIMLAVGAVFGIQHPGYTDLGLAIALMAPVYGAVFSTSFLRLWAGLTGAALVGFVTQAMPITATPVQSALVGWAEVPVFGLCLGATLYAAMRMRRRSAFLERAHISTYLHLAELVQDAVVRYGTDGKVKFVTKSAEALFGCSSFQLDTHGLEERVHVMDRPAFMKALSDAGFSAKDLRVDLRMRRDDRDGLSSAPNYIWVEIAISPDGVADPATGRREVILFMRDVSRRHAAEREMALARQAAEDASVAKSHFLATVGHELRTPLNAIVGFSEMMATGAAGEIAPNHREYAEMIHRSGHHLLDLVNMLLDASRIEAGKFELHPEAFAPADLVGPCLQIVDVLAVENNVAVKADIAGDLPTLVGDERACRQIIINLVSNAIKFSQPGGEVRIGLRRRGVNLLLTVADDGIGMDADTIDRLGEPFFQAQSGNSRSYEGTGLGLSIVCGLVELHDGQLNAFSEPGKGTKFVISLPLAGPSKRPEVSEDTTLVQFEKVQGEEQWHEQRSVNS